MDELNKLIDDYFNTIKECIKVTGELNELVYKNKMQPRTKRPSSIKTEFGYCPTCDGDY